MRALIVAHHYLLLEVYRDYVNMCAYRPDHTPLEECVKLPI
jgi:hypothetical protein